MTATIASRYNHHCPPSGVTHGSHAAGSFDSHRRGHPGKIEIVSYKLLSRLGGAQTIGPDLLGLDAPVHLLQASDDVDGLVSIAAMEVMDASRKK